MGIETREPSQAIFQAEYRGLVEGVLTLLAVPYGETSYDTPYPNGERFMPGSFRKAVQVSKGKKQPPWLLFRNHEHGQAIGRALKAEDTAEGLLIDFRLSTQHRESLQAEITEGLLPGASVGFRAVQDRRGSDGAREIVEAAFLEASLTPMGAYAGAGTIGLRAPSAIQVDLEAYRLPAPPKIDLAGRIRL